MDSQVCLPAADGCHRAALRGALVAGLPTMALSLAVPHLAATLLPRMFAGLSCLLPESVVPFVLLATAACVPGLLAIPVGLAAGRVARHEARDGRDRGLAAAAGAGLAAAFTSFGVLLSNLRQVSDLVALSPFLVASCLAVGVVGALAFHAVPQRRFEAGEPQVPALYHTLTAAGLAGPALVAGGGIWAGLAWAMPWLFAPLDRIADLPATLQGACLAAGLPLALTPFSYASSRLLGRLFPGAPRRALQVGLLLPPLAVMLASMVGTLGGPNLEVRHLPMLVLGGLLGVLPHIHCVNSGLDPSRGGASSSRWLGSDSRSYSRLAA
jgi:hypothetical protein